MAFVDIPNLPSAKISLAAVDGRIAHDMEACLEAAGISLIKTERHPGLYEAVSYHPDIMLHHLGGDRIVYAPGTGIAVLDKLEQHGFKLVEGGKRLSPEYPADIAYNGARIGRFFFHKLKYTDKILLKELEASGVELINVNQGYAKCAVAVIDEKCIITSDAGIAKAAAERGIEALLVPPQKNIRLPGLDYGFIGGSSGMTDNGKWALFGDAGRLEAYLLIYNFLNKKNIEIVSLSNNQVIDFGSLLPLKT